MLNNDISEIILNNIAVKIGSNTGNYSVNSKLTLRYDDEGPDISLSTINTSYNQRDVNVNINSTGAGIDFYYCVKVPDGVTLGGITWDSSITQAGLGLKNNTPTPTSIVLNRTADFTVKKVLLTSE